MFWSPDSSILRISNQNLIEEYKSSKIIENDDIEKLKRCSETFSILHQSMNQEKIFDLLIQHCNQCIDSFCGSNIRNLFFSLLSCIVITKKGIDTRKRFVRAFSYFREKCTDNITNRAILSLLFDKKNTFIELMLLNGGTESIANTLYSIWDSSSLDNWKKQISTEILNDHTTQFDKSVIQSIIDNHICLGVWGLDIAASALFEQKIIMNEDILGLASQYFPISMTCIDELIVSFIKRDFSFVVKNIYLLTKDQFLSAHIIDMLYCADKSLLISIFPIISYDRHLSIRSYAETLMGNRFLGNVIAVYLKTVPNAKQFFGRYYPIIENRVSGRTLCSFGEIDLFMSEDYNDSNDIINAFKLSKEQGNVKEIEKLLNNQFLRLCDEHRTTVLSIIREDILNGIHIDDRVCVAVLETSLNDDEMKKLVSARIMGYIQDHSDMIPYFNHIN